MESLENVNRLLVDRFSSDSSTNQAIWRLSWSDDQLEKRRMNCTPEGIQLLHSEVFLVKKYPYIKSKWVLERLVVIPDFQQDELPVSKLSYEPIYTFDIFPSMQAILFIVDTVYAALGKKSMAKYVDPDTSEEVRQNRIKELHQELFGNETDVGDALAYKQGVTVPRNYGDE